MNKKSESILDFVLAFIAVVILIVGVVRIWIWFNANYAARQVDYQKGRLIAGAPRLLLPPGEEPSSVTYEETMGTAATEACPTCAHKPLDLSEEWVFQPHFALPEDQKVGYPGTTGEGFDPQLADLKCRQECVGQEGCGATPEEIDTNCPCYAKCICHESVEPQLEMLRSQLRNYCGDDNNCDVDEPCVAVGPGSEEGAVGCGQIAQLRANAQDMDDKADDCDDPWEICWWFTWGKAADKLEEAADNLRDVAEELREEAKRIEGQIQGIDSCCELETPDEQQLCIQLAAYGENCTEITTNVKDNWQKEIVYLQESIDYAQQIVDQINGKLYCCEYGGWDCGGGWWWRGGYFHGCRYVCLEDRELKRWCEGDEPKFIECMNACCGRVAKNVLCPPGASYPSTHPCNPSSPDYIGEMQCREPSDTCHWDYAGLPPNAAMVAKNCGLIPFRDELTRKITEMQARIEELGRDINDVSSCCTNYSDGQDQWECIDCYNRYSRPEQGECLQKFE